jgi:hypothetical protein
VPSQVRTQPDGHDSTLSSPPEEGSFVVAALRCRECDADYEAVWRMLDRCARYGAESRSPLAAEEEHTARRRAEAQQQGLQLLAISSMSKDDVQQINCAAALLLPALRAAMDAVVSCAPDGRLRAATRTELCFLLEEAARNYRLRERSEALQQQGAALQLACEAAADVALGLGARAMEIWRAWSILSECTALHPDSFTDLSADIWEQKFFAVAAHAVHLALRCAMQRAVGGAASAALLPGSWVHAGVMLGAWQKVEACAQHSQVLRRSPSLCAVRATLTERGPAMSFLRATFGVTASEMAAWPPTAVHDPTSRLRRCAAPACAEAEQIAGQFKKCGRCGVVRYCSKACQAAHWKAGHKRECGGAAGTHAQP